MMLSFFQEGVWGREINRHAVAGFSQSQTAGRLDWGDATASARSQWRLGKMGMNEEDEVDIQEVTS